MDIARIKKQLKEKKITYEKLAEITGLSLGTIKSIMSGKTANPRIETVNAINEAIGLQTAIISIKNIEPLPMTSKIPIIGTIACGEPILAEENILDYIQADQRLHADFALIAKGDSMINARIFDGDIVYIKQQPDVDNGQIAAVQIDDSATLKRVYKFPGKVILRAENPKFQDIVITAEDNQEVRILGRAVFFTSIVR